MSRAAGWNARFRVWALETVASTRSAALIRIGLALLIWSSYARPLAFFVAPSGDKVLLGVVFFVATTLMLFGLCSRMATLATSICVFATYYGSNDLMPSGYWQFHHLYLLGVASLLLSLAPCGASYSLDRWRALRRARTGAGRRRPSGETCGACA